MKISIVVPAFNEERVLADTLAQIQAAARAFDAAGVAWELIVCDNNSSDRTAEIAVAAGARVVFERMNQISRARNAGAAAAAGEWLLFVDADSQPSRALLAGVARAIATGRTIAGGATMSVARGEAWSVGAIVASWNLVSRITRWMAGSFLFCEAAAFRQLGGFSERLFISEDVEFSSRMKRLARQSGRRVAILHRHPVRTSARKAHLYAPRDYWAFFWRMLTTGGRAMERPAHLPIWYDGRR